MNICVSKETRLNIRIRPEFKAELESVAEYHGLTVTSYVHSVLVKKIREEKEKDPAAFLKFESEAKAEFRGKVGEPTNANKLRPQQVTPATGELEAAKNRKANKDVA